MIETSSAYLWEETELGERGEHKKALAHTMNDTDDGVVAGKRWGWGRE